MLTATVEFDIGTYANRCHEPVLEVGRVAPRAPFREIGIKLGARGATRPTLRFMESQPV